MGHQSEHLLHAEVSLELVGTSDFAMAPTADDTRVQLEANWPHPSFGGRFLPVRAMCGRTDSVPTGRFRRWPPRPARLHPRRGTGHGRERRRQRHRVIQRVVHRPVKPYSLSDRAIKDGLLFIALTFVAVAMVEVMRRLCVHPIEYLLVGCALSIFFLLLLSLSEHLSFALSYGVASVACVGLLTFYGAHLLGGCAPARCSVRAWPACTAPSTRYCRWNRRRWSSARCCCLPCSLP